MICPQCRSEYREGFTECADCHVGLVEAVTPAGDVDERPNMELVTVFDSTNPALIGIAKSILEAADFDFLVLGGDGAGGVFSGNPLLGHVRLQVDKDREEEATTLLSEIAEADEPLEDDPPSR